MQKEQFIHIYQFGTKFYHSDREMTVLHREDGPAVEWANGDKSWYFNDKRHREDGPAIECTSGNKLWYLNGEELSEEEFNARMNPVTELTLDQIAEKFGVSTSALKIKK